MKLPHLTPPIITRWFIFLSLIVMFFAVAPLRHAVLFNLLPLCAIGLIIIALYRVIVRQAIVRVLAVISLLAAIFHAYNCVRFGVNFAFDSKEYWELAQGFASGHGLSGLMYRTPLYPMLAGIFILAGDHSGLFICIFQHALLILCVPGIYAIGRMFGFSQQASLIAASFTALNSLLMQAAGFIMTEIVFLTLALVSVASLKRLYDAPSAVLAVLSGASFAIAAYCRQLLFPILLGGLIVLAIKKGNYGVRIGVICLATYFAATAPWCLRNFGISGHYAMSANFGVQAFTKAVTFDCLNRHGKYFKRIEKPFENVLIDLKLIGVKTPAVPEDAWEVNRIPHVLIDSLKTYHGFSFPKASSLIGKVAMEGFMRHPIRYVSSISSSFLTLLFGHRDMYPDTKDVFPVETSKSYKLFKRLLRGFVYVSGYVFLLFPLALLFRGSRRIDVLMPFFVVCLMYLATAAIQIGLTRYTIPWEPFKALCAAYVVETIIRWGNVLVVKQSEITIAKILR